jgi:hypothetical protein
VHQVGDQPRLYYDARTTNHQDSQLMLYREIIAVCSVWAERRILEINSIKCRRPQMLRRTVNVGTDAAMAMQATVDAQISDAAV